MSLLSITVKTWLTCQCLVVVVKAYLLLNIQHEKANVNSSDTAVFLFVCCLLIYLSICIYVYPLLVLKVAISGPDSSNCFCKY